MSDLFVYTLVYFKITRQDFWATGAPGTGYTENKVSSVECLEANNPHILFRSQSADSF
jgi:hypothetical protein